MNLTDEIFSGLAVSGNENTEFVAADTTDNSVLTGQFFQKFTTVFYGEISFCMAEYVVDLFQMIQIRKQEQCFLSLMFVIESESFFDKASSVQNRTQLIIDQT